MMKGDNLRLIAEVKKRRALWDSTMDLNLRKEITHILWQEVANILKQDVQFCKKRFKGYRDSYRSEIRKIQQGRLEHSNWTYFRALEFLRDIFDPQHKVPFKPLPMDTEFDDGNEGHDDALDSFVIDVDNDDSFDFEIMGDIFKRDSVETQGHDSESDMSVVNKQTTFDQTTIPINRSDVESSPRLLSPLPLPKPPAAKRARRLKTVASADAQHYQNGTFHDISVPKQTKTTDCESDAIAVDPDRSFLVSLLPHVKMLSPMNNMKFRMEVTRLLMDLNQQTSPYPASIPNYNNNHECDLEETTNGLPSTLHAANEFLSHSSVIECDVKIENEPLL